MKPRRLASFQKVIAKQIHDIVFLEYDFCLYAACVEKKIRFVGFSFSNAILRGTLVFCLVIQGTSVKINFMQQAGVVSINNTAGFIFFFSAIYRNNICILNDNKVHNASLLSKTLYHTIANKSRRSLVYHQAAGLDKIGSKVFADGFNCAFRLGGILPNEEMTAKSNTKRNAYRRAIPSGNTYSTSIEDRVLCSNQLTHRQQNRPATRTAG